MASPSETLPASTEAVVGGIRGVHVLMGFVAFFGLVFAVNGVFLYWALATHTGVVSKQPYRKGLAYNQRILAEEKQQKLGWTPRVQIDRATGKLIVTLKSREGAPIMGLKIAGLIGRPSTVQHDTKLVLLETAPGQYIATIGKRDDGTWLVNLKAVGRSSTGSKVVYRMRRRLWLKQ